MNKKKGLVLLSGGLDSATVLAYAIDKGYETYTISFDYGQRHRIELARAEAVSKYFGAADHFIIHLDPRPFQDSALTGRDNIPTNRKKDEMFSGIASTYVPARNMIFLSLACALGEELAARDVFIGVNSIDYSGYPDCRPAFVKAFEKVANLATSAADGGPQYQIHAPLMELSKKEIILLGTDLGVDYGITVSCYQADDEGRACGRCDACILRKEGFEQAGVVDPTPYQD